MTSVDLTGKRFGKWTVVGKSKKRIDRIYWDCVCDCGTVGIVRTYELQSGRSRSCGCTEDLTGQVFGRWTVIKQSTNRYNRHAYWECECECGTIKEVSATSLKGGRSKSCGCYKQDMARERMLIEFGESNFNTMYYRYKHDATRRSLAFELSKNEFRALTQQSCYYCGASLGEMNLRGNKANGKYIGNGVDRIDNNIGYTLDNSVPCCSECNYAKGTRTVDEFLSWATRLVAHQELIN